MHRTDKHFPMPPEDLAGCAPPRRWAWLLVAALSCSSPWVMAQAGTGSGTSGTETAVSHTDRGEPQLQLPMVKMQGGMHLFEVQVASQPAQRSIGLMWRRDMPPNEGMLFVFERPSVQCFWMKNTLLPLTAAFLADDGSIVNLADMAPQTTEPHCSARPVRYVLEMHQGWFERHGLGAGARLKTVPAEGR